MKSRFNSTLATASAGCADEFGFEVTVPEDLSKAQLFVRRKKVANESFLENERKSLSVGDYVDGFDSFIVTKAPTTEEPFYTLEVQSATGETKEKWHLLEGVWKFSDGVFTHYNYPSVLDAFELPRRLLEGSYVYFTTKLRCEMRETKHPKTSKVTKRIESFWIPFGTTEEELANLIGEKRFGAKSPLGYQFYKISNRKEGQRWLKARFDSYLKSGVRHSEYNVDSFIAPEPGEMFWLNWEGEQNLIRTLVRRFGAEVLLPLAYPNQRARLRLLDSKKGDADFAKILFKRDFFVVEIDGKLVFCRKRNPKLSWLGNKLGDFRSVIPVIEFAHIGNTGEELKSAIRSHGHGIHSLPILGLYVDSMKVSEIPAPTGSYQAMTSATRVERVNVTSESLIVVRHDKGTEKIGRPDEFLPVLDFSQYKTYGPSQGEKIRLSEFPVPGIQCYFDPIFLGLNVKEIWQVESSVRIKNEGLSEDSYLCIVQREGDSTLGNEIWMDIYGLRWSVEKKQWIPCKPPIEGYSFFWSYKGTQIILAKKAV